MSSFPNITEGMRINPLGKTGIFSRYKGNVIAACSNAFMNLKIVRGGSDEFHLTPNNATIMIKRESSALARTAGIHPFKIYPTGTVDGIELGYNVRAGMVDVRPRYVHATSSVEQVNWNYAYRFFPDNIDVEGPSDFMPDPIPSLNTFFLDPTPEISLGINVGAYYSFWINITPDTNTGGSGGYDGVVSIQSQRFSIGSTPTDPFPGLPAVDGSENIPIGIVQVTAADTPLFTMAGQSNDGLIWQWLHDNYTDYLPGQTGTLGGCFQGFWGDPGVADTYRYWYPGDWTIYNSGVPLDLQNGRYDAFLSPQYVTSAPSGPLDLGMIQTSVGDL